MTERQRKTEKQDSSERKQWVCSLEKSTGELFWGKALCAKRLDPRAQSLAVCSSIQKNSILHVSSNNFLLPKIADKMLDFGSVLEGEGAAALHAEAASGKRS